MFEPIAGKFEHVRDPLSSVEVFLRGLPDYLQRVTIQFPDGRSFAFVIALERKFPERPFVPGGSSDPTIRIQMGDLDLVAKAVGGTVEENTQVIKLMLTGLSQINKLWPLTRNPFFYSDRDRYMGQESRFSFIFPTNEEISNL